MLNYLKKLLTARAATWQEVERFDPAWRERIERMCSFMRDDDLSVVDVGCGPMWLRDYLPSNARYVGVDYVDRGEGTIVCDLNEAGMPDLVADVWFVSGCLEYLEDPERFIASAAKNARSCILSYCELRHFPSLHERKKRGWRNHLTAERIDALYSRHGMRLVHRETMPSSRNSIFVFRR